MSLNIYDVETWTSGRTWNKHDIVVYSNLYYYALAGITNSTTAPSSDTTNWGGYKTDLDGNSRPNFLWSPSYGFNRESTPLIKRINFGDGYTQRSRDGISHNLLTLTLKFDNRKLRESRAIEHFLQTRGGTESFLFIAPSPYSKEKRFICEKWTNNNTFYDSYSIETVFQEVAI